MYEDLERFSQPWLGRDEEVTLWRYMDFTKFVDVLMREGLFFSRADKLGDKFEGSWTRPGVQYVPSIEETWIRAGLPDDAVQGLKEQGVPSEQQRRDDYEKERRFLSMDARYACFVSCWHQNDHESAAMWNYYAGRGAGLAIRTTLARLKTAFRPTQPTNIRIHIGAVQYVDYDSFKVRFTDHYVPILFKRLSFKHEAEVRAVLKWRDPAFYRTYQEAAQWVFPADKEVYNMDDLTRIAAAVTPIDEQFYLKHQPVGKWIAVCLDTLIEEVCVAPDSPEWIVDLVRRLLDSHGLNPHKAKHSRLDDEALY